MKRRQSAAAVGLPPPALPSTSVVLGRFPVIRDFLSTTAYDDGCVRVPGYMTLRNRGSTYELTWYDPDSGLRLPVRAGTLDDVLALSEQLLAVDEAPWEVDGYLTEQLARRGKKRRAS